MRSTSRIIILLIFFVISCTNSDRTTGADSNAKRKEKGIPIIENGWIADTEKIDESASVITWHESIENMQSQMIKSLDRFFLPKHTQKSIYVKDGVVQSEADTYTNGTVDDKTVYSITIKYNQFVDQKEKNEWEASLSENPNLQVTKNRGEGLRSLVLLKEQGKIKEEMFYKQMDSLQKNYDKNYVFEDKPVQKISIAQADSIMKKWGISRF